MLELLKKLFKDFYIFTAAYSNNVFPDPLSKEVISWMEKEDVETVKWTFQAFPSQNFKDTFAGALLEYVQGTQDWDYVVQTVKDSWKSEKAE